MSKNEKKFREAVRKEAGRQLSLRIVSVIGDSFNSLMKYGWPVGCLWVLAWAFVKSAPEIGGRDTQVKLALGVFGELLINKWVYLLIAGLCGGGWWMNRRVYRGRISEMADQIKAMEQQIDPGRRGSGLDKQGQSKADR